MNPLSEAVDRFRHTFTALQSELGKVLVGQQEIVEGVLVAFFAGGHVLLEGVPGLGKTLLVRTLAEVMNLHYSRVQFTPDLMPADIIGTNIILEDPHGRKEFQFQPGPVFTNILLADEINRATPKTQSALLEAMQEHHVTVGGKLHQVEAPFLVMATQNPLEMEGTYALPEAQLDRFFFKLKVNFPSATELHEILDRTTKAGENGATKKVIESAAQVLEFQQIVREIPLTREVQERAVQLVMATHGDRAEGTALAKRYVRYGASPRGAQTLILAAKVHAILAGRYHVAREDIDKAAPAALRHRIILNFEGEAEGQTSDNIIQEALGL